MTCFPLLWSFLDLWRILLIECRYGSRCVFVWIFSPTQTMPTTPPPPVLSVCRSLLWGQRVCAIFGPGCLPSLVPLCSISWLAAFRKALALYESLCIINGRAEVFCRKPPASPSGRRGEGGRGWEKRTCRDEKMHYLEKVSAQWQRTPPQLSRSDYTGTLLATFPALHKDTVDTASHERGGHYLGGVSLFMMITHSVRKSSEDCVTCRKLRSYTAQRLASVKP